ncbi:unnamed protein product [Spirodela intermedia]|uniref:NADP-dependent oxidoreductase domain-containing protein n=1 Tax=Spirodela intermedia TaxID=51605 RepID=A0A7I8JGY7_SPIIN|nr:unnamed protein product [Spirodela intermedia]CAA6669408.1 unnamed protein product [Spirodela intermedia]
MPASTRFFALNTGAKIPSLGLGTWQADPGVVGNAVIAAVKVGYRHIDCARIYGNEKEVGQALKELFEDGTVRREDLFITSKIWCSDLAAEDVPGALQSSLDDLQLDYLDLYLIHWPCRLKKGSGLSGEAVVPLDINSTWKTMERLYDEGKARAIGVSNFSCKKLEDVLVIARVPPAVNQVECHPCWQQRKLRTVCKARNVHLSGYSPLGSPGTAWISSSAVLRNPAVKTVAEKLGRSPAQVALRWGVQMGHSVLPKTTKEARLRENMDIFDWSIPEELFAKLEEIEQARGVYSSVEELWDGEI